MVLSRVLFASRSRRVIPPLLCLFLAVVAGVTGQFIGVLVALGFVLLAIQFKIGAELSGRLARLASAHQAARHALNSASASTRSVAARAHDTERRLDGVATELQRVRSSAADDIRRLQEGQEELRDEVGRLIASLQPIRRHRSFDGETLPDLSLSSSMEMLAHRFRSDDSQSQGE